MSEYVPHEVIAEIFTRLPPKSLVRFRSLSKLWCSRIGSSDFIRKHASLSPKKLLTHHRHLLAFVEDFYTLYSDDHFPLYLTPEYGSIILATFLGRTLEINGSCDGMLFLLNGSIITLWNPSIGRKLTLSGNSNSSEISGVQEVAIGIGYDLITNDYKIVTIFYSPETSKVAESSMVYSINSGVWHPIAAPTWPFKMVVSLWGCLVNGVLHWIVEEEQNHRYILTFELSTEVFGMITLPKSSCRILTTINGSLAAISRYKDYSLLWVRKEYNNVSPWRMVHKFEGWIYKFLPLANGNFLFETSFNQLMVYIPVTGMQTRHIKSENYYSLEIVTYVESLALIDKGVSCYDYKPSSSSLERLQMTTTKKLAFPGDKGRRVRGQKSPA